MTLSNNSINNTFNNDNFINININTNFQNERNISANDILSKLTYECQNCGEQIKSDDIKSHLDSNCVKISNIPKTLAEEFKTKKTLRKITPEETEKMRKEGRTCLWWWGHQGGGEREKGGLCY